VGVEGDLRIKRDFDGSLRQSFAIASGEALFGQDGSPSSLLDQSSPAGPGLRTMCDVGETDDGRVQSPQNARGGLQDCRTALGRLDLQIGCDVPGTLQDSDHRSVRGRPHGHVARHSVEAAEDPADIDEERRAAHPGSRSPGVCDGHDVRGSGFPVFGPRVRCPYDGSVGGVQGSRDEAEVAGGLSKAPGQAAWTDEGFELYRGIFCGSDTGHGVGQEEGQGFLRVAFGCTKDAVGCDPPERGVGDQAGGSEHHGGYDREQQDRAV